MALALVAIRDSPDAPVINDDYTLDEVFSRELADLHSRGFDSSDNGPHNVNMMDIVPTSPFLLTSLLSGLSIKYNLTESSDQYGNIWENLNTNWSISEVGVIGACIQLLASGSIIIRSSEEYDIRSADDALTKLKVQKSRMNSVKDSNVPQFLEVCHLHFAIVVIL